ncbi:hypothetical protein M8J76_002938 [Diaphorina citri]|nr:hypothetical protein M8J76_002938 [Diaphorina citri]
MRKADLSQWKRGIIVLGGDGILYEIINGLMERADWCTVLQTITLGIVPCGSGNGLAKSISHMSQEPHDQNPVLVSTLNIVQGVSTPMDLIRAQTKSQVVFSFLSIGWGLLADIDIESERIRAVGSQRFAIWNKILVVLNPKSGVGKARDIFQQRVVPILTDAEIDYDVHVTSCPNDASFLRPNNSPNLSPSPRTSQTPNTDKEEKRPTSLDISQSS